MNEFPRSPKIVRLSWGRIEVEAIGSGKDFKLYPGGGREWDWGETGTRHNPGVQPADVEELVENGAVVVVVGCGMFSRLKVSPAAIRLLEEKGVEVHAKATKEAVDLYNSFVEDRAVGGLFHSTC